MGNNTPTHVVLGAHDRRGKDGKVTRLAVGDKVLPTENELRTFPDKFRTIGHGAQPQPDCSKHKERIKELEEQLEVVQKELTDVQQAAKGKSSK